MNAQVKIDQFLLRLTPVLHREKLALCSLEDHQMRALLDECLCIFREREGLCGLLPEQIAQAEQLTCEGEYRQITLKFSQDLQVPGVAATIVRELAEAGIHANVVSARVHEHILVADRDASQAMQILHGLSNRLQYS
ncbi:ACT domain-containing protein [Microbulbifer celer]|uniref:ACT domain-containing protein n=1 Tax=Microbulbifer celer TaxID=435905 RepID=A0ABW3U828_9GAMM|nr:ACT domain-containing protein [Microbulbifer celer]UFN56931.1 ACT domain-containing protein [Microbulbifer celer]